MVSVASIEPTPALNGHYRLAAGVQVRGEKEGLLFYNRKGPRLYFMACGKLLRPEYFNSGRGLSSWLAQDGVGDGVVRSAVASALEELVLKGVLSVDSGRA